MMPSAVFSIVTVSSLLIVAGCSSTPDGAQAVASTSDPLASCAVNQTYQCTGPMAGDGVKGIHITCACVQDVCSNAAGMPVGPTNDAVVEAWAVTTDNDACPPLPGNGGTWMQPATPADGWNGVPTDMADATPDCSQAFPGAVSGSTCCTYVWWPAGYPNSQPPGGNWAKQDPSAICTNHTLNRAEITEIYWTPAGGTHIHGAISCGDCIGP